MYFKTVDTNEPTLVYDMAFPSSHKHYFLKSASNKVYWEKTYTGNGVFAGKDYFIWVAELNLKNYKTKSDYELREIGENLYKGTHKIFVGGKEKQIQWPEILADDEKPWKNRKPEMYLKPPKYPELEGKCVNCECDVCLMIIEM